MKDPDVNWRIILKRIFIKWNGSTDWIDVIQSRDRWEAFVNGVMDFRLPKNAGNFLIS